MKKLLVVIILCISFLGINVYAKENREINVYLFYGEGCPHCHEELKFLNKMKKKYDINVIKYEVWNNKENSSFLEKVSKELGVKNEGVPTTIIGNSVINGYNEAKSKMLRRVIKFYSDKDNDYFDSINLIKEGKYNKDDYEDLFLKSEEYLDHVLTIKIPLLGNVNLKNLSINTSFVLLGVLSSFNVMTIILVISLMGILIRVRDNKKRIMTGFGALGIIFLALVIQYLFFNEVSLELFNWLLKAFGFVLLLSGIFILCDVRAFKNKFTYCFGVLTISVLCSMILFNLNSESNLMIDILISINDVSMISLIFNSCVFVLFYLLISICLMFIINYILNKNQDNKYLRGYLILFLLVIGFILI